MGAGVGSTHGVQPPQRPAVLYAPSGEHQPRRLNSKPVLSGFSSVGGPPATVTGGVMRALGVWNDAADTVATGDWVSSRTRRLLVVDGSFAKRSWGNKAKNKCA